jgi:hypothetical protein
MITINERRCVLIEGQRRRAMLQGFLTIRDLGQKESNPIVYLRGMKEIEYSYVQ